MRYNLDACADRQRLIAEAIGVGHARVMSDTEAGLAAADAVNDLCRALGLPRTLREVDVPEEGLAAIAAATLHDRSPRTNPKPIGDAGPIMAVLRAATSASSSLNFGVESFQFHAGIFNAELPVDPALFGIRLVRPGYNFSL